MIITLSNSEEENKRETSIKAFTGILKTISNTSSEDLLDEELEEAHKHLTPKWKQSCQIIERQKKLKEKLAQEKEALSSTATGLKEEVTLLKSILTNMTKSVRVLNKGTDMLKEVLEIRRRPTDRKGLGFDNYTNEKFKAVHTKRIPPKKKSQEHMTNQMSQHPTQHKHQK
jgi:hypothetical protein